MTHTRARVSGQAAASRWQGPGREDCSDMAVKEMAKKMTTSNADGDSDVMHSICT